MSLSVLVLTTLLVAGAAGPQSGEPPLTARQLARYLLTEPMLKKFAHATRLMIAATRDEPRFVDAPLFTKDIFLSGDAAETAAALQKRIDSDPALAGALFAADLSARDYTSFAVTLVAARLAHGFIESGVLRGVPTGVAENNVQFVARHHSQVSALLRDMGLQD